LKIKKFNCSPKLDQIVELPSRGLVRDVCQDIQDRIVNQVFLVNDLVDLVGHFIARRFRVNVMHAKAWEVEPQELNLNAFYDPSRDEKGKPSIELVLVTNPNDTHLILDLDLWNLFLDRLADTLAHELIHMRQARCRQFLEIEHRIRHRTDIEDDLVYLSDPDEIDAYSYNIATELSEHRCPFDILKNPSGICINHSVNLWAYIKAFSNDLNDPSIKKLLKKVYKHLTK
jgi:hypothetical protein